MYHKYSIELEAGRSVPHVSSLAGTFNPPPRTEEEHRTEPESQMQTIVIVRFCGRTF